MTNYLRFADESTWIAAATEAGFYTEPTRTRNANGTFATDDPTTPVNEAWDSTLLAYTHDHAIDVVGTIYQDDAVIDPNSGEVITSPTPMPGWHVNFIGVLPTGWDEFLVTPVAPYRVFA